jgi:predicted small secreted protein
MKNDRFPEAATVLACIFMVALVILCVMCSGCRTMDGFGQDISAGARALGGDRQETRQ